MSEPATAPRSALFARALLALAAVLVAGACGRGAPNADEGAPASFEQLPGGPAELAGVASEPVVGFTGPGSAPFEVAVRVGDGSSHLERRIGARTFALPLRTAGLARTQYPCSSCHQGPVTARRDADVHQNVKPVHPPGVAASCLTCHRAGSVDRLALNTGESATFDHAYRLCAQCHFAQVDAWAEGHHGKRLDGWRGRRVVLGCADCHDPHNPTVAQRAPFPGPRLPATGTLLPGGAVNEPEPRFRLPPNVVPKAEVRP